MPGLGSWPAAAYAAAVGLLGLGLGIPVGWRACVHWAASLPAEWAEPEPEPVTGGPRLVAADLTLAASLPGPLVTYRADPARVQLVPWVDPGTEYLGQYAPLWAERAARLAWVDRQVSLIMARVGGV